MTGWSGMREKFSLSSALEEWLLLAWRDIMDNGWRRGSILPSVRGRTPSRTMIFMRRLQKGIHVRATIRVVVFPMVWKMWAQISIKTPVMRSRSSKVNECSVRESIKVREHDQFESRQFRCKLCSADGCTFTLNLMIRPKNLKNVLYLRLFIIIWSEVYICAKALCNVA